MKNYKERLHNSIPGGAHTYSRGDDQFPSNAPPILSSGKGAYVYDPNGEEYLDYGMGLRSVNIGYGNKEVAYNSLIPPSFIGDEGFMGIAQSYDCDAEEYS